MSNHHTASQSDQWSQSSGSAARIRAHRAIVLRGHSAPLNRVRFSPNGRLLASASTDGAVLLWDVETQTVAQRIEGLAGYPTFSPDGKLLACTANGGKVMLHKPDGHVIGDLPGHEQGIVSMVFSPNGHLLATGDGAGTVRLWEVAKRRLLTSFAGNDVPESEKALRYGEPRAFSPDGTLLAVIAPDKRGAVQLYHVTHGSGVSVRWQAALGQAQSACYALAISPDGRGLAYATAEDGLQLVRLSDLAQHSLAAFAERLRDATWAVAFSPDGHWLAEVTTAQGRIGIWDVATKQLALMWDAHTDYYDQPTGGDSLDVVGDMDWSPDGRYIATCGTSPFLPPKPDALTGLYPPLRGPNAQPPQGPDDFTVKLWEIQRDPPWDILRSVLS